MAFPSISFVDKLTVIATNWLNSVNTVCNNLWGSAGAAITADSSNNVTASANLTVTGSTTSTGNLTVSSPSAVKGRIQVGTSSTAANNFTLTAQADDGTMKLARGNNGATTQDLITVSASNVITGASGATLIGNGPAFSYVPNIGQGGIASNTFTKITAFGTSEFDTTGGAYASSRFTATIPGYYCFTASVGGDTPASTSNVFISFYKNGVRFKDGPNSMGATGILPLSHADALIQLNANDYIEVYVNGSNNGSPWGISTLSYLTYFQGHLVRGI